MQNRIDFETKDKISRAIRLSSRIFYGKVPSNYKIYFLAWYKQLDWRCYKRIACNLQIEKKKMF